MSSISITIRLLTGHAFPVEVSSELTVSELKGMIENRESVPKELQRLVWNGHELEDSYKLSDYNVPSHAVIFFVTRGGGGAVIE
jgi:hypothetical protein